jgi:hypothetical protein
MPTSGLARAPTRMRLPEGRERVGRGSGRDEPGLQVGHRRKSAQENHRAERTVAAPLCAHGAPRSSN